MPSIAVDCTGIGEQQAARLAAAVRAAVVQALPETEAACTCRVRACQAAAPGEGAAPFAWIDVALFPGRGLEWKRVLYAALAAGCARAGIAGLSVTLREPALENWGIRGGVPAADVFQPTTGREQA